MSLKENTTTNYTLQNSSTILTPVQITRKLAISVEETSINSVCPREGRSQIKDDVNKTH